MRAADAIRLLRPKQWTKGLLVFAAWLFTRGWEQPDATRNVLLALAAISLASSAVYVANDLADLERDRAHPVKKDRPLPSGRVTRTTALILGLLCLLAGLGIGLLLPREAQAVLIVYLAVQAAYNGGLKRVPVLDVFVLGSGFILRAALGAAAISVSISGWLLFCTGALALLVGFGKRRHEFELQGDDRARSREALAGYTRASLDALTGVAAACAAMCYGIYALDSPTAEKFPGLVMTTPFVLYGISRYLWLIFAGKEGGEPESLFLRDPHLIASVALFVATSALALQGVRLPLVETGGPL